MKHNCQELINRVPFFEKEKEEGNFVTDVLARLKFEMAMPDDIIVKADTKADKMYFIQEGMYLVYTLTFQCTNTQIDKSMINNYTK